MQFLLFLHFSFPGLLRNLILIAAVIDNAKNNDILFLLIDQVIGNIILHQDAPHVIPFQIRVMDRPACIWCLTDLNPKKVTLFFH